MPISNSYSGSSSDGGGGGGGSTDPLSGQTATEVNARIAAKVRNFAEADKNVKIAASDLADGVLPAIVDNLESILATEALSANQGRLIKGYLDAINTFLTSDDITLDTFQEIVAYAKANKAALDRLSIAGIAGLSAALTTLDGRIADVETLIASETRARNTAITALVAQIATGQSANDAEHTAVRALIAAIVAPTTSTDGLNSSQVNVLLEAFVEGFAKTGTEIQVPVNRGGLILTEVDTRITAATANLPTTGGGTGTALSSMKRRPTTDIVLSASSITIPFDTIVNDSSQSDISYDSTTNRFTVNETALYIVGAHISLFGTGGSVLSITVGDVSQELPVTTNGAQIFSEPFFLDSGDEIYFTAQRLVGVVSIQNSNTHAWVYRLSGTAGADGQDAPAVSAPDFQSRSAITNFNDVQTGYSTFREGVLNGPDGLNADGWSFAYLKPTNSYHLIRSVEGQSYQRFRVLTGDPWGNWTEVIGDNNYVNSLTISGANLTLGRNGELADLTAYIGHPVYSKRDMPSVEIATRIAGSSDGGNGGLWIVGNNQTTFSNREDARIKSLFPGILDADGNEISSGYVNAVTVRMAVGTHVRVYGVNDFRVLLGPSRVFSGSNPILPQNLALLNHELSSTSVDNDRTILTPALLSNGDIGFRDFQGHASIPNVPTGGSLSQNNNHLIGFVTLGSDSTVTQVEVGGDFLEEVTISNIIYTLIDPSLGGEKSLQGGTNRYTIGPSLGVSPVNFAGFAVGALRTIKLRKVGGQYLTFGTREATRLSEDVQASYLSLYDKPDGLKGRFVSSALTWTINEDVDEEHGLGGTPTNFWGQIVCVTPTSNLVVGDTWQFNLSASQGATSRGINVLATPTRIGFTSEGVVVVYKNGIIHQVLTNSARSNFKIYLYATI